MGFSGRSSVQVVRVFNRSSRSGCSGVQPFGRDAVAHCSVVRLGGCIFFLIGGSPRLWVRQFFPCAGFSGCRVVGLSFTVKFIL